VPHQKEVLWYAGSSVTNHWQPTASYAVTDRLGSSRSYLPPETQLNNSWQHTVWEGQVKICTIPAKTSVGLLGLKQQHCGCDRLTRILQQTVKPIASTSVIVSITHTHHTHNHFTALWILSGTTRVSCYQKVHITIFWIFWCKMKITQADTPTIWMDCHPIQTNWCPISAIPPFLCRMPFLAQPSQFILQACILGGLVKSKQQLSEYSTCMPATARDDNLLLFDSSACCKPNRHLSLCHKMHSGK